jgi:hypothetical protein
MKGLKDSCDSPSPRCSRCAFVGTGEPRVAGGVLAGIVRIEVDEDPLDLQSRISNTSHHRPAADSGSPARHFPSACSPWLVPSHASRSVPEKIQLNSEKWCTIDLSVPPTSPKHLPISSLPLAKPHLGKYTCASSANRSRIEPPLEVVPPLSNAFRYSIATDLRCSSVIVSFVRATVAPLRRGDVAQ